MTEAGLAVVIGVGPERGLGASLAMHFSAHGLHSYIVGRSAEKLDLVAEKIRRTGGLATPVVADATIEQDMDRLFLGISQHASPLNIAVYNVDSNASAPLLETGSDMFMRLWQQNCFGAFLFGKRTAKVMKNQGSGTLIFTGATASLRARPPFTAFAAAKSGLRALAQGMAREFGPHGVHVAHVIIDGVIDGDRARHQFADLVTTKGESGLLKLDAIAESYWAIHQQPSSAWTHELDLRPYKEPF